MQPAARASTALIIPALNEEEVIGATLAAVPESLFGLVIVADNGSTDRTGEIARQCGALVVREDRRGYGAACLKAIAALPPSIEFVAFAQADGSEDPAEASLLLEPLWNGCSDFVLGSRTLGQAEAGALLAHQDLGNRLITWLIRVIHGYRYTDLGPFRAIRRDCLDALAMRDTNYGWTVEMQVKAARLGLRIREIPVRYGKRRAGVNKVSGNWKASLRAGVKMISTVLRLAFRR